MTIDENLLEKLQKLSAIKISEEKKESMSKQIAQIVDFVENLNELDLSDKDDHFSTINGGTPFREDTPKVDKEVIKQILKHAPKQKEGFFVVPKIIE